jgi:hypothetical protein
MNPFGSSENMNPSGKPCEVTGLEVPGTITRGGTLPATFTFVIC